jgi:hypothetical protein
MAFLPIILDVLLNLPYSIRIDATLPNVMSKGLTIPLYMTSEILPYDLNYGPFMLRSAP